MNWTRCQSQSTHVGLKMSKTKWKFSSFQLPYDGIIRSFTPDMGACKILLCTWDREIEKIETPLLSSLFYSQRNIKAGNGYKIKLGFKTTMRYFRWCLFTFLLYIFFHCLNSKFLKMDNVQHININSFVYSKVALMAHFHMALNRVARN